MSILATVAHDLNIAETWVKSIASKAEALFAKVSGLSPEAVSELKALVASAEAFLAAATPAVEGEGLNFPADSVAYEAFKNLIAAWQKLGGTVVADLAKLKS